MPQAKRVNDPAELLRLVELSEILTPRQLQMASQLAAETPDCTMLARRLIAKTLLTRWQASQLLAGWHRLRLGKYKLSRQIGRGQLGRVFLAEHIQLGRQVAIKTLSRRFTQDKQIVEKFLAEASQVSRLDHPHILHLFDIDHDHDQYYLIMAYVPGRDLGRMVEQDGPLPFLRVAEILRQAALGLAHAHQLGIVHTGIRPANVMVDEQESVKILDFGFGPVGRVLPATGTHDQNPQVGDDLQVYLAPEQLTAGGAADERSDIYSLGCTAYWLLTGCPPFPQGSVKEPASRPQPASVATLRSDAPPALVAIVDQMMAPDPQRRTQTADQVAATCAAWLAEAGSPPTIDAVDTELVQGPEFVRRDIKPPPAHSEPPPSPNLESVADPNVTRSLLTRPLVLIGTAAACALGLVLVGSWWFFFSGGGSSPPQRPPRQVAQQRPTADAPKANTPAASDTRQKPPVVESTLPAVGGAMTAGSAGQPPLQKPAASGGAQPPAAPSAPTSSNSDPTAPQPAAPPKPAGDQPEAKSPPDKAPPAKTEPGAKPEQSPAEAPPPKPKPVPNPLEALPAAVGLPLPTDPPESEVVLGPIKLGSPQRLGVTLLGGDTASTVPIKFQLVPWAERGDLAWRIQLQAPNADETQDIARLQVVSGQVQFAWDAAAHENPQAAQLVNCVLRFRSDPHTHDLRLRKPEHVDPLLVNLRRTTVDLNSKLVAPPATTQVRLQVTSLQPPFPEKYQLEPAAPIGVEGREPPTIWITLGETADEQVVKLELTPSLQRMFRLRCAAYFQLDRQTEPQPLTSKNLALVDRAVTQNQLLRNAAAQQVRNAYSKIPPQDPKRKAQKGELDRVEAELAKAAELTNKLELLATWKSTLKDGGPVHFRVFFVAGDCEVDLLTTSLEGL